MLLMFKLLLFYCRSRDLQAMSSARSANWKVHLYQQPARNSVRSTQQPLNALVADEGGAGVAEGRADAKPSGSIPIIKEDGSR